MQTWDVIIKVLGYAVLALLVYCGFMHTFDWLYTLTGIPRIRRDVRFQGKLISVQSNDIADLKLRVEGIYVKIQRIESETATNLSPRSSEDSDDSA